MCEAVRIFNKYVAFAKAFGDRRIALYGLGGHTEYILSHLSDTSNIVGLMDAKRTGEIVYGLRVYSLDEIATRVDVVVIIARVAVERLIYERIKKLSKLGIGIYNVNGEEFAAKYAGKGNLFENDQYWDCSLSGLKAEIDRHTTISFDIFDTLLMRRVIRPHDELGFAAEKRLNVMRKDVCECFYYAIAQGKSVFLLSDMYYSSQQLGELLQLNGIKGYKEIIVSCEHGATKEDGDLYEVLKQKATDANILHIGDNLLADIENAKMHGIDAFYVMSTYDMILHSPMYALLKEVPSKTDSRIIGEWAAALLNSPFALHENRGCITIHDIHAVAEYFFPIVAAFMGWLVNTLRSYGEETLLLFLARDGYLIKRLYDWIKNNTTVSLPESVYFLASRDAVSESYSEYRKNYKKYARSIGIYKYKRVLVYDLATKGTTVSKLSEILAMPLELICFASFNIDERFDALRTRSFLGDHSFYTLPYHFLRVYELLEIMSAPNKPQFLYFDDSVNPVYSAEECGKQWDKIAAFQETLFHRFQQYVSVNAALWDDVRLCKETADQILGLLESSFAVVDDNVKESFMFDSPYEGVTLTQWWDKTIK